MQHFGASSSTLALGGSSSSVLPPPSPSITMATPAPLLASVHTNLPDHRRLVLADGSPLTFSADVIPEPPYLSFAKDINWLNAIWDDSSSFWDPSRAVLHMQRKPIALVYWPEIYRYQRNRFWEGLKSQYMDWKVSPLNFSKC